MALWVPMTGEPKEPQQCLIFDRRPQNGEQLPLGQPVVEDQQLAGQIAGAQNELRRVGGKKPWYFIAGVTKEIHEIPGDVKTLPALVGISWVVAMTTPILTHPELLVRMGAWLQRAVLACLPHAGNLMRHQMTDEAESTANSMATSAAA